jgi:hypothetical protein
VTHNGLAANQRPHISLIDRRRFYHAAFPIGLYVKQKSCESKAEAVVCLLTALSHINVEVCGAASAAVNEARRLMPRPATPPC